ncbi:MAG TPA: NrfD/PsrC family molybdoenzyme membrane anchor subunit [Candidatus Dormibacteraeota bacterium]
MPSPADAGPVEPQLRDSPGARRGRGREGGERPMVPQATFTSYYGRPVVKPSPWAADIPAYLFLGGLAGASSILAAGADLTGRPSLRRTTRIGAVAGVGLGFVALIHDLGRPERFVKMLRVAKPTSPMSMGTWILSVYAPLAGLAGAAELTGALPGRMRWAGNALRLLSRPAGLGAAGLGAAVASYTAVLLADTATPTWHDAGGELPFIFAASSATAAAGLGMLGAPLVEAGPARRLAVGGAVVELLMERRMETSMGLTAEPLHAGRAGALLRASRALTAGGAVCGLLLGRRSRAAAALSGIALLAGSVCTRFGIFEAGQMSARDPRYTIVPQRERLAARSANR